MSDELADTITMTPRHLVGNWPHVLNMANSIIGVSVLALPFCFKQCGILLGFLLLMGSAWLTRLTCHLLMKSAFATKKRSYEYLAFHIFGRAGKLIVELSIIGLLIGTCIAFYIIIGDLGPAVVSKVTGLENTQQLRSALLVLLTGFIVVPLAMLHSLDSLSNFSAASLTFYCVFVAEVIVAAFPNLWSGIWMSKVVFWNTEGVFKCLPIFALCFACQTQLFIMSDALPEPSLNRVNRIVHSAVIMCSVIYVSVGCFGYIAFCDDYISGDILMNFSPTFFSEAIKLGFVTSTLISFPLVIFPCRASLYTLLFVRKGLHDNFGGAVYIPPSYFKGITISIIGVTLTIGLLVPNIEFMLAITGATMGSLICYILPAILFIMAISVDHGGNTRSFAQLVLLIGVTILLASSYVTLMGEDKVVKHESVVKLGQPIEHNEDNLAIHNDEELKKKLEEIKDQMPPFEGKLDGIHPDLGGAINKDVKDAVTAAAGGAPPMNQEVIDSFTVAPPVDEIKQVNIVDKSKEVAVDNSKRLAVEKSKEVVDDKNEEVVDDKNKEVVDDKNKEVAVDKNKEVAVEDSKLPNAEEDKRKEPPNPHAPVDPVDVVIVQEKIEDSKKDNEAVGNQSKEAAVNDENRKLVERAIAEEPEKTAEKQLDEKPSQAIDAQPQASDAVRPALAAVLQPKLESQHAGKKIANGKPVKSNESHDTLRGKTLSEETVAKLGVDPSAVKVVKAEGVRLTAGTKDSLVKDADFKDVPKDVRPVEVQHKPETRGGKLPDEQPVLPKSFHVMNDSAKAEDVGVKVSSDRPPDVNQHEAKIIIEELKKQQQEQRQLLDEQRKIVDELRRHQLEVHQEPPSQTSKGPDQPVVGNAADKANPEASQRKEEKPTEILGTEKKAEKVVLKVSSREEHDKGEKVVAKDSPNVAKESNKNPNMDDSDLKLNKNNKVVQTHVVEVETLAKKNLNIQDSDDHANKIGDVDKNALEMARHPDVKHDAVTNSDDTQNKNIPKHGQIKNIDVIEQSQNDRASKIVLKEEKLDFLGSSEKLASSKSPHRPKKETAAPAPKKSKH